MIFEKAVTKGNKGIDSVYLHVNSACNYIVLDAILM